MKILVTGSTGLVGSHIVDYLCREGYECIATDKPGSDFTINNNAGAIIKPLDLIKENPVSLVEECEGVVHVAGVFDLSAPKELLYAVNVEGARKMADAAYKAGVKKFIHISTTGVYGKPKNIPCYEEDPKKPRNAYERTKWLGECAVVEHYEKHDLPLIVLRPTLIYGPRARYGHAVAIGVISMLRSLGLKIRYGLDRGPLEHSVHVEDVAKAVIHALKNNEMIGRAYNIADETPLPLGEKMDAIAQVLEVKVKKYIKYRPWLWKLITSILNIVPSFLVRKMDKNIRANWNKLLSKLNMEPVFVPKVDKGWLKYISVENVYSIDRIKSTGFQFKYPDFKDGIRQTIEWYINHKWIPTEILRRNKKLKKP